jgi:hypothetical protein
LKSYREANDVTVMLNTPGDVADDEYGRGTHHHRVFLGHPTLSERQNTPQPVIGPRVARTRWAPIRPTGYALHYLPLQFLREV